MGRDFPDKGNCLGRFPVAEEYSFRHVEGQEPTELEMLRFRERRPAHLNWNLEQWLHLGCRGETDSPYASPRQTNHGRGLPQEEAGADSCFEQHTPKLLPGN